MSSQFQKKVGLRIKQIRLEKGYLQIDIAEDLGVTRQMISKVERGEINLSITYLRKLSIALETTPADLIDVTKKS